MHDELIRCRKWIEAALKHSGDTHDFVHIVDGLIEGKFQFWANEQCRVITEVIDYR